MKKPLRKHIRALCADVHEDDGVDPRDLLKKYQEPPKTRRKAQQLCGQVAETLGLVLADSHDDALNGLIVVAVEPAPDASRLLVTLRPSSPEAAFDPVEVLDRLEKASGRLRSEAAAAITRRKAPSLAFRLAIG